MSKLISAAMTAALLFCVLAARLMPACKRRDGSMTGRTAGRIFTAGPAVQFSVSATATRATHTVNVTVFTPGRLKVLYSTSAQVWTLP